MKKLVFGLLLAGLALHGFTQEVKINHNGTDGFAVESDGTPRLDGAATTWNDLRVTLDKGNSSASFSYAIGSSGPQIYWFVDNTLDAMSFTVQLPHDWKQGTTIYPHIHWMPINNNTGTVQWFLEYTWQNYVSAAPVAFPAITTVNNTQLVASNSQSKHLITALTADNAGIDGTGKNISSILICRIYRNAVSGNTTDTYGGNAGALFVDFHYEVDGLGSHSEYTK